MKEYLVFTTMSVVIIAIPILLTYCVIGIRGIRDSLKIPKKPLGYKEYVLRYAMDLRMIQQAEEFSRNLAVHDHNLLQYTFYLEQIGIDRDKVLAIGALRFDIRKSNEKIFEKAMWTADYIDRVVNKILISK